MSDEMFEKKNPLAPSFSVPLEDSRKTANLHKLKIEEEMRNDYFDSDLGQLQNSCNRLRLQLLLII